MKTQLLKGKIRNWLKGFLAVCLFGACSENEIVPDEVLDTDKFAIEVVSEVDGIETRAHVGGTTSGAGLYAMNEDCTVTATPDEGYLLESFEVDDLERFPLYKDGSSYTFPVPDNMRFVAKFKKKEEDYSATYYFISSDTSLGTVDKSSQIIKDVRFDLYKDPLTATAIATGQGKYVDWEYQLPGTTQWLKVSSEDVIGNNLLVLNEMSLSFNYKDGTTFRANFIREIPYCTISLDSHYDNNGSFTLRLIADHVTTSDVVIDVDASARYTWSVYQGGWETNKGESDFYERITSTLKAGQSSWTITINVGGGGSGGEFRDFIWYGWMIDVRNTADNNYIYRGGSGLYSRSDM